MSSRHPSLVAAASVGCVVEFLQGNEAQVAWVEEESGGKLRLYTQNKRETKLPAARLLPWIGPRREGQHSREAVLEHLRAHVQRREELMRGIDALEIWEMAQGEVVQSTAAWFAQLVFEEPDVDHVAAMGRALLDLKTHFKFHPPNFEVYPAEMVERRLAEQAVARERELVVTAGQAFFHELWTGWSSGRSKDVAKLASQLDPAAADKLRAMLMGLLADPESQEWTALWQSLRKGLPEHQHMALILATQWGIVAPHHDYLMDQAGYREGDAWSQAHAAEIEALAVDFRARREAPDPGRFVSVDSSTTRDIDDAFLVEAKADGGFTVRMALARPTLSWNFDSPLGREVWDRSSSLYLPEGSSHMMPEALSCGLYSLRADEDRPALLLDWELDAQGREVFFDVRLGWARVAANRHYAQVERELAEGRADQSLAAGAALAERLRAGRVAAGAVVLDKPDTAITLEGYPRAVRVEVAQAEEHPRAQLLVSELMILANASVARWAATREVSLLHRVQDIAIPPACVGVWTSPVDMHRVVKHLSGAVLDVRPARHASLGAAAYSPITSPLRRLTDLVNMAQVQSFLATGAPRLSREELAARLPGIVARQDQVAQVQRYRPRYWKLLFIQQHCREREFEAVVVEEGGGLATLSLPGEQIYVRAGREQLGGKVYAGQRFSLRLGKVDPLGNEVRVLGAMEIEGGREDQDWPEQGEALPGATKGA